MIRWVEEWDSGEATKNQRAREVTFVDAHKRMAAGENASKLHAKEIENLATVIL